MPQIIHRLGKERCRTLYSTELQFCYTEFLRFPSTFKVSKKLIQLKFSRSKNNSSEIIHANYLKVDFSGSQS